MYSNKYLSNSILPSLNPLSSHYKTAGINPSKENTLNEFVRKSRTVSAIKPLSSISMNGPVISNI